MDSKKKVIATIIIGITLSAIIFSGCTDKTAGIEGTDIVTKQPEETAVNHETENTTITSGEKLSEPVQLPGTSITERTPVTPKYDSETKEQLVKEAKNEILQIFPNAYSSSLNNYHWDSSRSGSFTISVITFEGVITDTDEPGNICEIDYDPEKGRIIYWEYDHEAPIRDTSGDEIISHEDVDIEEDIIPIFKRMVGEEEYEENKDNYFIYTVDSWNDPMTTIAYIYESCKGVESYMGYAQIYFNRVNEEAVVYGENFNDKEFFEKSVTLSSIPGISLDEAKSILEAKLDEVYSDNPQEVQYDPDEETTNCLLWLDASAYMDIEDGYLLSPIPLAWGISYSTKESRAESNHYTFAAIDANTGEILSMYNSRIDIHGKNYD